MAPIRLGLIGLSGNSLSSWAAGAHLPYLLSAQGKAKFEIVALCNSSVESARKAIELFKLPPEVKAYGSPKDIANDPDVELVASITRVDLHHETILPSIEAGKDVFVEWPLAHNRIAVEELVEKSRLKGIKAVVGLQGRQAPFVVALKTLLEQGKIGKVLSADAQVFGGSVSRDKLPEFLYLFTQREIGGNPITIGMGHAWDWVQYLLGTIPPLKLQTTVSLQRPLIPIFSPTTKETTRSIISTVPDLVIATGTLPSSNIVAATNAPLSFRFRRGPPFPSDPALIFKIAGEKGEIKFTSKNAGSVQAAAGDKDDVLIELHDFESDEVKVIDWSWEDWQQELPLRARNVGALYEAFANQDKGVATFVEAGKRHDQIFGALGD